MTKLLRDRLFIGWILLVAVTLVSVRIGGPDTVRLIPNAAATSIAVLCIAFAKVAVVMFEFMEVRGAPNALRALCTLWLLVVLSVLLIAYLQVLP